MVEREILPRRPNSRNKNQQNIQEKPISVWVRQKLSGGLVISIPLYVAGIVIVISMQLPGM
jgi:hypothetical protein